MKTRTLLVVLTTLILTAIFPPVAKAQDPFKDLTENFFVNATKSLFMIDQDLLGLDDEVRGEVTFRLPQKGKDIEVFYSDGTQKILSWNGKGFTLKEN